MKFSLWAPYAKSVELCLGSDRRPLQPGATRDWWEAEVIDVPAEGIRYRYSIDGGPPLPDPMSLWQPDGVHGDSWAGPLPPPPPPLAIPCPLANAVLYEIHIGTFTPEGTYRAARSRLPHLVTLGVTHVELMPLATFPGHHGWGYDGTYWFAPHPDYGTPAELAGLVADCHEQGLAVLLDVVYNHFGPDGNYLPHFGPWASAGGRTLWGEALNFDGPGSDGMRQLVLANATHWLRDYGFDGLRLDAVHAISDQSATHLLEELATHVRGLEKILDRPLLLIAESNLNDPRLVRAVPAGGYGLDAFWADDFHHAVHRYLTGENHGYYADFSGLADIARALREGYVYQGQYAVSRDRRHGRAPGGVTPDQLVFCLQNHDQVGNRAGGERLSHLLPPEKLKLAAALLLLAPQVPLLFQGEEWGACTPFLYFTDHVDLTLQRAVSAGRQREFPDQPVVADPQDPATFRRSALNWTEPTQPIHAGILAWYRQLIALRRHLTTTRGDVSCDEAAQWLILERGDLLAAFNFADHAQAIPLPEGDWTMEFSSSFEPSGPTGPTVPATTAAIYFRASA